MKMIMNVLDGAIWHTCFQMKSTQSGPYKKNFFVKIKDIPKIENLNDDIRFNVYGETKDQTI